MILKTQQVITGNLLIKHITISSYFLILKNNRFQPGFLFDATLRADCSAVQIFLFVYCG